LTRSHLHVVVAAVGKKVVFRGPSLEQRRDAITEDAMEVPADSLVNGRLEQSVHRLAMCSPPTHRARSATDPSSGKPIQLNHFQRLHIDVCDTTAET